MRAADGYWEGGDCSGETVERRRKAALARSSRMLLDHEWARHARSGFKPRPTWPDAADSALTDGRILQLRRT